MDRVNNNKGQKEHKETTRWWNASNIC